jgi:hypothetical protein
MGFGSQKDKFKFSIVVRRIAGHSLEEMARVEPKAVYRVGWVRGKKDGNKGVTSWVGVTGTNIDFKHPLSICTVMVKKQGGYEPKPLKFVVEEEVRGSVKLFGTMTIDLAQYVEGSREEQRFPLVHAATGKALRLHLIITPKPIAEGDTADNDDAMSQCSDVGDEPVKASARSEKSEVPKQPEPKAKVPATPTAAAAPQQQHNAAPPTPKVHNDELSLGAMSLGGSNDFTSPLLNLTILRMVGAGLAPLGGSNFRVGYKQAKDSTRFTEFAPCHDSTVTWKHPMVIHPCKEGERKIKFTVQQGSETSPQEVLAFAVDIAKLQSVERKEFAFGLTFPSGAAKLHLAVVPPADVTPQQKVSGTPNTVVRAPSTAALPLREAPREVQPPRAPTPPQATPIQMQQGFKPAPSPTAAQQRPTQPIPSTATSVDNSAQLRQQSANEQLLAENASLKGKLQSLSEENETLKQKLSLTNAVHQELERVRAESLKFQQEVTQKESTIAELNHRMNALQCQLDEKSQRLNRTESSLTEAKKNADHHQRAQAAAEEQAKINSEQSTQAKQDLATAMRELEKLRLTVQEATRVPATTAPRNAVSQPDPFDGSDDEDAAEMGEVVDAGEVVYDTSSEDEEEILVPVNAKVAQASPQRQGSYNQQPLQQYNNVPPQKQTPLPTIQQAPPQQVQYGQPQLSQPATAHPVLPSQPYAPYQPAVQTPPQQYSQIPTPPQNYSAPQPPPPQQPPRYDAPLQNFVQSQPAATTTSYNTNPPASNIQTLVDYTQTPSQQPDLTRYQSRGQVMPSGQSETNSTELPRRPSQTGIAPNNGTPTASGARSVLDELERSRAERAAARAKADQERKARMAALTGGLESSNQAGGVGQRMVPGQGQVPEYQNPERRTSYEQLRAQYQSYS